jgi:hypothetical protein
MVEKNEKIEKPETGARTVHPIRRATRKKYTAEDKIRMVPCHSGQGNHV